ncbi:hypothetical protein [Methylobacterium marchantiae]|uniref:Uncharacterized protein n=1 Tax=Methylobacterium marchantiae TaxID=600331 RepID=A0ABW3X386_9HYPH|nr:hypothetical protein AIGOOFII_2803 [Methylobacterium marchantiae]
MARSDKDNGEKERALKFCITSGLIPFLEVDVRTGVDLSESPKLLTDIDVLGLLLREDGSVTRTIFDCKGTGGPAFARALWLSGLMKYAGADEGIILMGKPAERAHRLAARKLNVRIFGSGLFDDYAAASNAEYKIARSYAGSLENWHRLFDESAKEFCIKGILKAIQQEVPLTTDAPKSLRRLISRVLDHKGELNPKKQAHMAIFTEATLSVSILLSMMIGDIRNILDLSDEEREFTSILRYYVWGGQEGVSTLRRMYELLSTNDRKIEPETTLVAWPQMIQLLRGMLEAPTQVRNSSIALRELSLRYLGDRDNASDVRAGRLFAKPRARQFTKRIGVYATEIFKLPIEFSERMDKEIDELVALTT